jgi:hypothetical protein
MDKTNKTSETGYIPVEDENVPMVMRGLELLQQDCLRAAGETLSKAFGTSGDSIIIDKADRLIAEAKEAMKLADEIEKVNEERISHPDIDKIANHLRQYFAKDIRGGVSVADNVIRLLSEYREICAPQS